MVATKDNYGKVYIRLDNGEIITLKTFHKRFPEWVGLKTAEVMEALKVRKEVTL